MGNQGRSLTEREVLRIIALLATTELSMPEIATRMGCSRSAVTAVNSKHGIRNYEGSRAKWKLGVEKSGSETHLR